MDISIIILNYKQKELVKQCLSQLRSLDLKLAHEIIVVDNDSSDGCLEMVKENFPSALLNSQGDYLTGRVITIQSFKNRGYSAGNNSGIKEAKGKYILILNPDVSVSGGVIEKMYQFMETRPECGLCGPKLLNPDGSVQLSCCHFPNWKIPAYRRTFLSKLPFAKKALNKYLMAGWNHKENQTVDCVFGACLMARKSAIDEVGLMDERFFLYFEDVDWCRRFWQAGYEVYYIAGAEMIHRHQRLSAKKSGFRSLFNPITRIHIASGIKYFWKYKFKKLPRF